MKTPDSAIAQLTAHIDGLLRQHRTLKPKLEHVTKELATLGAKPDEEVDPARLPIDAKVIEQVQTALKDGGKNVKNLQKALGIFDYTEMTRKRKALVAAGVTHETENYQGTNATFVELAAEPVAKAAVEAGK